MRIQSNIAADNSQRQLGLTSRNISVNTERLSSGFRINRASDDAAGLAISEKMRTQIRGLNRASLNIQDGISLLQVGDSALQSIHDKMQRLRELAVQAANDTNQTLDRQAIQLEFGQLTSEINSVVSQSNFNGRLLFDGSIGASWDYNLGKTTIPYITTIPAASNIAPGGVNVPGWTVPGSFGVASTVPNLGAAGFPTSGIFAMQLVTPADGTLNVVLDFADENAAGTMTRDDFLTFFRDGFNNLGLGNVVDEVRYNGALSRIEFDFPRNGSTLTGVMGKPSDVHPPPSSAQPRVLIGLGADNTPIAAQMRDSLNGVSTFWSSPPFRTNRPDLQVDASTTFANMSILGSNSIPFPAAATAPAGGFSDFSITVDAITTTIRLMPGNFPDAQSFVDANHEAFETAMPRGFNLNVDEETGRLVVTTRIYTDGHQPSVSMSINPVALGVALGFGSLSSSDITTEPVPADAMRIQSGANRDDGVEIEIPRLCTRSLGLSIRRPEDERVPPNGFEHTNTLGASGYTATANVAGTPMEFSLDITSHERASAALPVLTNAINIISMERARMGAQQNRLESARLNADNTSENLQSAESRIRDIDMAAEMTTFVQNQILQQSGTAMLAQANALPQGVLQLLG